MLVLVCWNRGVSDGESIYLREVLIFKRNRELEEKEEENRRRKRPFISRVARLQ